MECKVWENKIFVKCWVNIWNIYLDVKVDLKWNEIEFIIFLLNEDYEFVVFGILGIEDKKWM